MLLFRAAISKIRTHLLFGLLTTFLSLVGISYLINPLAYWWLRPHITYRLGSQHALGTVGKNRRLLALDLECSSKKFALEEIYVAASWPDTIQPSYGFTHKLESAIIPEIPFGSGGYTVAMKMESSDDNWSMVYSFDLAQRESKNTTLRIVLRIKSVSSRFGFWSTVLPELNYTLVKDITVPANLYTLQEGHF